MEVTINHTAKVQLTETAFASLHTTFYGGHYIWSGMVMELLGKDEMGLSIIRAVGNVMMSPADKFWITPEDAIEDAISQFYVEERPEVDDRDYHMGELPTGWDAADHKALYE